MTSEDRPQSPANDEGLEDPNWTKKKKRIVRQLLDEFDLEKVREKYRCTNPIEFRVHPSEYSVGCSLAINLIRQRLLNLMGTDHVRINDREYIHKLIERVEEEYEKEEEKKERGLQENEKRRLRRLLADGVITPEEINEMDAQKRENQRELRTPPPRDGDNGKLVTEKPKPFIYFDDNNKKVEDEEEEQKEDEEQTQENGDEESQETDATTGEQRNQQDDDVDPLILNLREGNTVDEIYRRAEELLRGVNTQQQQQQQDQQQQQQQ